MANGTCINSTGETILVYGPNSDGTPQDRDNSLYRLPTGRRTPANWDCDGIYVPNDRIAHQLVGSNIPGPVAIKYGLGVVSTTFEITRNANEYNLSANQGAFRPDEVCCPSDWPNCVCWNIPNHSHTQLSSYREVPGHIPA
jgi:hypothetical protein